MAPDRLHRRLSRFTVMGRFAATGLLSAGLLGAALFSVAAPARVGAATDARSGVSAAAGLRRLGEMLGLRFPPPDAHGQFLDELQRVAPARLVDAASRALAAGDYKQAATFAGQAQAILRNPLDLSLPLALRLRLWAASTLYMGQSLAAFGDAPRALQAFHDLDALAAAMQRLDAADTSAKQFATAAAINIASVALATGAPEAALIQYGRAKALLAGLVAGDGSAREPQQTLASTDRAIGELKLRAGDIAGALTLLQAARQREIALIARNRQDVEARLGQARADITIADALFATRDLAGTQASYAEALKLLADVGAGGAASLLPWRYALAESRAGLASVSEARGDAEAAIESYRRARDDFLALVPLGGSSDPLRALGSTNFHLAAVLAQRKDTAGALDALRDAIDAFTGLLSRNPGDPDAQRRLVASFGRLADLQSNSGDQVAALGSFGEARDLLTRLAQIQPASPQLRRDIAISNFQIGKLLAGRRDVSGAVASLRTSLEQLQALLPAAPRDLELRRSVWTVAGGLGSLLEGRRDLKGALAAYRSGADALAAEPSRAAADPNQARGLAVSAERISSVGYMLTLERDFSGALQAQDLALRLAPGTPWIEANRAHALMLLGRTTEARGIYLRHRGEKLPGNIGWADANRNDFAELRRAGIASPLMDEVEKALATRP